MPLKEVPVNLLRSAKGFLLARRSDAEMCLLSMIGFLPVHRGRVAVLRALGAQIDPEAVVYGRFQVRSPKGLVIGRRANIGDRAILDARGGLTIGANANLSTAVEIWTAQHDWNSPDFRYVRKPVIINDRAWLGPRVTVLPGAVIGEGVVVAAGAVVSGELEPFGLYGGVPARRIADRDPALTYELPSPQGKTWWW